MYGGVTEGTRCGGQALLPGRSKDKQAEYGRDDQKIKIISLNTARQAPIRAPILALPHQKFYVQLPER